MEEIIPNSKLNILVLQLQTCTVNLKNAACLSCEKKITACKTPCHIMRL